MSTLTVTRRTATDAEAAALRGFLSPGPAGCVGHAVAFALVPLVLAIPLTFAVRATGRFLVGADFVIALGAAIAIVATVRILLRPIWNRLARLLERAAGGRTTTAYFRSIRDDLAANEVDEITVEVTGPGPSVWLTSGPDEDVPALLYVIGDRWLFVNEGSIVDLVEEEFTIGPSRLRAVVWPITGVVVDLDGEGRVDLSGAIDGDDDWLRGLRAVEHGSVAALPRAIADVVASRARR